MDNIGGKKSSLTWAVHLSVAALVLLWVFPTLGLLVSSFRTTDQIRTSGWWAAMFPAVQNEVFRTANPAEMRVERDGVFVVEGNLYVVDGRAESAADVAAVISAWGVSSRDIAAFAPGEIADLGGKLYDQFVLFAESFEEVGDRIQRSQDAYEKARGRLSTGRGNLVRRADQLRTLGVSTARALPDGLRQDQIDSD